MNEQGFRFAIAIDDYLNQNELKNDPRYVQWRFRLFKKVNNKIEAKDLEYKLCDEDDYAEFYPI